MKRLGIGLGTMGLLVAFSLLAVPVSVGLFAERTLQVSVTGISLTPREGPVGATVSVEGEGFSPNETGITVTFEGEVVAGALTADDTGSWNATFAVPAGASNAFHWVDAFGDATHPDDVPDQAFDITPHIALAPTEGRVGEEVTVTVTGFGANETGIQVTFVGELVAADIQADAEGGWETKLDIPARPKGTYTLAASGDITGSAQATFAITPAIAVSPDTGPVDTSVTITGTGFEANEAFAVTHDAAQVATGTAGGDGGWTTSFNVPAGVSGDHLVDAFGDGTDAEEVPDMTFGVTPGIRISPQEGPVGTDVTVAGAGFEADEQIEVTYDGEVRVGANADANGSWDAVFQVPASRAGEHGVDAGGVGLMATDPQEVPGQTFTVTAAITIVPPSGPVGTVVTIAGTNFAANEANIAVRYDGETIIVANPPTDAPDLESEANDPDGDGIPENALAGSDNGFQFLQRSDGTLPATGLQLSFPIADANLDGVIDEADLSIKMAGSGAATIAIASVADPDTSEITLHSLGAPDASDLNVDNVFAEAALGVDINGDGDTEDTSLTGLVTGFYEAFYGADMNGDEDTDDVITDPLDETQVGIDLNGDGDADDGSVLPALYEMAYGADLNGDGGMTGAVDVGQGDGILDARSFSISNGTPLAADGNGAWTATFSVPAGVGGDHQVDAVGPQTLGVDSVFFNVDAGISLDITQGPVEIEVEVTGTNYAANETGIQVTYDGARLDTTPSTISASDTGSWTATFQVPQSAGGPHTVDASGSRTTDVADQSFTVTPAIEFDPVEGEIGREVSISGTGFSADETGIAVTFANHPQAVAEGITANPVGGWSTTFEVPTSSAGGQHTMDASGDSTPAADVPDQSFTVLPGLSLSHNVGVVGSSLTASGAGFSANESVQVTYDTIEVPGATATADDHGSWSVDFSVPSGGTGSHIIDTGDSLGADVPAQAFFTSIQVAIDTAESGNLILVGPGTYDETLNIDTPGLAVESIAGTSATFISPSGGPTAVIAVGPTGDGLRLGGSGFTIEGAADGGSAIQLESGADDVVIQHNAINLPGGGGTGVLVGDGTVVDLGVLHNVFTSEASGPATALFANNGLTNGLLIEGNTIDLNGDVGSVGLDLVGLRNVMVLDNEIRDAGTGIKLRGYSDSASPVNTHTVLIEGNVITSVDVTGFGIEIFDGDGGAVGVSTSGIDIVGNSLSLGAGDGINIASTRPDGLVTDIEITDNQIADNAGDGVRVGPAAPGSNVTDIRIHFNDIHGNVGLGVNNLLFAESGGVEDFINARWNYWGHASGPTGGPEGGTGEETGSGVRYSAWMARPRDELGGSMEWRVDTSDNLFGPALQETIGVAGEGDRILVYPQAIGAGETGPVPGVYGEALLVDKALVLLSLMGARSTIIDARGTFAPAISNQDGSEEPALLNGMTLGGPGDEGFTLLADETAVLCDNCPDLLVQNNIVIVGPEVTGLAEGDTQQQELGEGIVVGNSQGVRVRGNRVSVTNVDSGLGILLFGAPSGIVDANAVDVVGDSDDNLGIVIDDSDSFQVAGNDVVVMGKGRSWGIRVLDSDAALVQGNSVAVNPDETGEAGAGLALQEPPPTVMGIGIALENSFVMATNGEEAPSQIVGNDIEVNANANSPFSGVFSVALGIDVSNSEEVVIDGNTLVVKGSTTLAVEGASGESGAASGDEVMEGLAEAGEVLRRLGVDIADHGGSEAAAIRAVDAPGIVVLSNDATVQAQGIAAPGATGPVNAVAFGCLLEGVPQGEVGSAEEGNTLAVDAALSGENDGLAWAQGMDIQAHGSLLVVEGNQVNVESSQGGQGIWVLLGEMSQVLRNSVSVRAALSPQLQGLGWGIDLWHSPESLAQRNDITVVSGSGGYGLGLLDSTDSTVDSNTISYEYGSGSNDEGAGDGINVLASDGIHISYNVIQALGNLSFPEGQDLDPEGQALTVPGLATIQELAAGGTVGILIINSRQPVIEGNDVNVQVDVDTDAFVQGGEEDGEASELGMGTAASFGIVLQGSADSLVAGNQLAVSSSGNLTAQTPGLDPASGKVRSIALGVLLEQGAGTEVRGNVLEIATVALAERTLPQDVELAPIAESYSQGIVGQESNSLVIVANSVSVEAEAYAVANIVGEGGESFAFALATGVFLVNQGWSEVENNTVTTRTGSTVTASEPMQGDYWQTGIEALGAWEAKINGNRLSSLTEGSALNPEGGPFPTGPIGILLIATFDGEVAKNGIEGQGTGIHIVESLFNALTQNTLEGNGVGLSAWCSGLNNANFNDFLGNEEWGILNLTPSATSAGSLCPTDPATVAPDLPQEILERLADDLFIAPLDGTFNWFGDAFGPSGEGSGAMGDPASLGVLFSPWTTRNHDAVLTERVGYFGMERPEALAPGWNTLSIPLALEASTLGDIVSDISVVRQAFDFDASSQSFRTLGAGSELVPGQAILINVSEPVTVRYLFNPLVSNPPSRAVGEGWNLISIATPLEQLQVCAECERPFEDGLADLYGRLFRFGTMSLRQALVSLDVAGDEDRPGWTILVSPLLNRVPFVFTRNTPDDLEPDLSPFVGYWVHMENQDILGGFNSTPVPLPPWAPE